MPVSRHCLLRLRTLGHLQFKQKTCDSIFKVKEFLQEKYNISVAHQKLFAQGKSLNDADLVSSLKEENCYGFRTICLVLIN